MIKRSEKIHTDVLTILRQRGDPLSAYDILAEMRETHPRMAPPTIYRALGALIDRGRVHRIESLNAYIACQRGHHQQTSVMSICDDCGSVEENIVPDLMERLAWTIGASGFAARRPVIEIHGLCAACWAGMVSA